ncbi:MULTISPECIES: ABC transporter permease subunit [unclassified Bacillus (in: firmicutes)]|uniref:ABC transporter permease subunit n=1 Tax=unclassified Bacillus (in: firmicutes) TaxID=185979 RepID=UPI001BEA3A2A|nr:MULTISPECIES: ABC transporter permease subunit [unclassified Bacillus (in: firmicutes)]MBT2637867.1 ABC transporter permease subunit [Bacillus sp. ISL-39]MBT2661039.1 ABC transporter permease subunit [Bacillus sp. ISL-45]
MKARFIAGIRQMIPWAIPILLLVLWQLLSWKGIISERILPAPTDVFTAAIVLIGTGELTEHITISLGRAMLGFLIGGLLGFFLGIINGIFRLSDLLLDTSIQMLRNIPHLALIPLVILWFGIDETSKIFLVALGVLFPVYINTYHGIKNVDSDLIEMGKAYGLKGVKLFLTVIFPGALSSILVGIRFSLGVMWLTLIVAETISAHSGIGYMAMNAREFMQMDVIVLSILIYALFGKLSDMIARYMEGKWLKWKT